LKDRCWWQIMLDTAHLHLPPHFPGVGSAGVLDRLNDQFRARLAEARSAGRPYHYITFEAGINDLLLQKR
jgi:hypothetical protein